MSPKNAILVSTRSKGIRIIPAGKWRLNQNTPVGEDADLWELKPYGGKKPIFWKNFIGEIKS